MSLSTIKYQSMRQFDPRTDPVFKPSIIDKNKEMQKIINEPKDSHRRIIRKIFTIARRIGRRTEKVNYRLAYVP